MANKNNNYPRRKRMKKEQRLYDAKTKWLPTSTAENLVRSYSKWYGVDLLCAIKELETLGFPSSKEYINQVELSIKAKADNKRRRKEKRDELPYDYDETFSYIAGYTESGVPFGLPHEED